MWKAPKIQLDLIAQPKAQLPVPGYCKLSFSGEGFQPTLSALNDVLKAKAWLKKSEELGNSSRSSGEFSTRNAGIRMCLFLCFRPVHLKT